ncbi:Uncharacterised protein [Vibrio cholerae]|nr:Uncharacterised protein [Vibrio cholerae]CSI67328.1 Uncharacterised protein [Vibrio cholerae]
MYSLEYSCKKCLASSTISDARSFKLGTLIRNTLM